MASGYSDWHKGVKSDIIAQTLDKLAVDIVAQTLDKFAVDIVAQTVGNIGINIKAQDLVELAAGIRTFQAEAVEWVDVSQTASIAANSSETIIVRAPAGYIYEVVTGVFVANPPGGATTGVHEIVIDSENLGIGLTYGESAYSDGVEYVYGKWLYATSSVEPATDIAQLFAIRGVRVDSLNGLEIYYYNGTDGTQSAERIYKLWFRKLKVS